jgi:hypothetical protein
VKHWLIKRPDPLVLDGGHGHWQLVGNSIAAVLKSP